VDGYKFRRQAPIGSYIVDFLCPARRLVIEVDGQGHDGDQVARDVLRTKSLEALGYRVIRFTAEDIFTNLDGVYEAVRASLPAAPHIGRRTTSASVVPPRSRGG
jgi:very-short-patch-repair endonuclease